MGQKNVSAVPNIELMAADLQARVREKLQLEAEYIDKGGRFRWNKLISEDVGREHDKRYTKPFQSSPPLEASPKKSKRGSVLGSMSGSRRPSRKVSTANMFNFSGKAS